MHNDNDDSPRYRRPHHVRCNDSVPDRVSDVADSHDFVESDFPASRTGRISTIRNGSTEHPRMDYCLRRDREGNVHVHTRIDGAGSITFTRMRRRSLVGIDGG